MGNDHSHDEGHGESKPASKGKKNMSDGLFERAQGYITKSISRFVAFLFILVSIGAVMGYFVAQQRGTEFLVIVPAFAGILAYYNRDFAVALFAVFLLLIIFI